MDVVVTMEACAHVAYPSVSVIPAWISPWGGYAVDLTEPIVLLRCCISHKRFTVYFSWVSTYLDEFNKYRNSFVYGQRPRKTPRFRSGVPASEPVAGRLASSSTNRLTFYIINEGSSPLALVRRSVTGTTKDCVAHLEVRKASFP